MPFDGNAAKFVKPAVFSLPGLIAWLETQPADKTYCYLDTGACLLHQFAEALALPITTMHSDCWLDLKRKPHEYPVTLNLIAARGPHTFGAALDRARQLLATA